MKFLGNTASYFRPVKDCHMAQGLGLVPYGFRREYSCCWLGVPWSRTEMSREYRSNSYSVGVRFADLWNPFQHWDPVLLKETTLPHLDPFRRGWHWTWGWKWGGVALCGGVIISGCGGWLGEIFLARLHQYKQESSLPWCEGYTYCPFV